MCARHDLQNQSDCLYYQSESKKGYDSDSSGHTLPTRHQWSDLINPDLLPMDFDVVLVGVLRSTTEMEKIKELDDQEFQGVIDVLGQVRHFSIQRPRLSIG